MRAAAQLLNRPGALRDPAEVVRRTAGIQAQDANAARLGIRARSARTTASDVERARAEERSIVRVWAMRGTLHLLATEDLGWQLPLFAEPELEWSRRRLSEALGVDRGAQERAVRMIAGMLEAEGTVTRREVLDRLESAGVAFDRQTAGHHLPRLAVLEGVALLGPDRGRETTYVLARDWIEELRRAPRDSALAELARRYLAAFGPADERDMAAWAGLNLGDCRAGLAAIASELAEVRVGERRLAMLRTAKLRAGRGRLVRLLPGFDNYLIGHASREFAVPSEHTRRIWPGGGIIRPTLLVDGVVAGTWTTRRAAGRIRVSLEGFAPLDEEVRAAVSREVEDIGRFEGLPVTPT
ncbi:MAG: winged helix DNA-binding domain-containing protein [Solirubrobacterales bacterium]